MSLTKELLKPLGRKGYRSPDDPGPSVNYAEAEKVWDRRIGEPIVQAKNWRFAFFLAMLAVIILIGGLIYQNSRLTTIPYIISVDSSTGMPTAMGTIPDGVRQANEKEIAYFLSQFVRNTRGYTLDPVVNRQNWSQAYKFMLPSASGKMDDLITKENPFDRAGKETVDVKIHSVVPVSKTTYQVRWTENVYSADGRSLATSHMTGLYTIEISTPKQEADLRANPLGIYIRNFAYSAEV